MIEILKKTKDLLFVYKPAGIPSQKDLTGDEDALTLASCELELLGESGALWLVHRLDRTVGGVLVFARNKKAAAELSAMIAENRIEKSYLAVTEGYIEDANLCDYLYHDKRAGRAIISTPERKDSKFAELSFENISENNGRYLVRVRLKTGRFHQIRAQLSSRGAAIVGDKKYGSRDHGTRMPALFAYSLSFSYKGEYYSVTKLPDDTIYPWSNFRTQMERLL